MSAAAVGPRPRRGLSHLVSTWGLLALLVVLLVVFSALKPDTFPTYFNFRSIVNNKSVQALLVLAVFVPMTANHFDLSVGFLLGIAQVLVIGLQGSGLAWPEAAGIVLLLGAAVGLANGVLVTVVGIDSFIATLGTGTLIYGINEWYTGGQQVVATLPDSFLAISGAVAGIPLPALYVAAIGGVLFAFFEYLPAGRYLYVLGASPRTAELNGISARRYVTAAFVAAGVLSACAGIVLQSQLEVGQSSVEPCVVGADNFSVDVVPPVDPEVFHPCHQHLIMRHGIHLHEGMNLDPIAAAGRHVFAYVFAPLPIVGATGSPGAPFALL